MFHEYKLEKISDLSEKWHVFLILQAKSALATSPNISLEMTLIVTHWGMFLESQK